MAQAWERLLLAFLQRIVPSIADICFPFEWVFHQSAIISLENAQSGMVRIIAGLLWALPWFRSSRVLLFVSAGTEPVALSRAAWRIINVTNFSEDIIHDGATGRVALDATDCRLHRPELKLSAVSADLVARRWQEYGIV